MRKLSEYDTRQTTVRQYAADLFAEGARIQENGQVKVNGFVISISDAAKKELAIIQQHCS